MSQNAPFEGNACLIYGGGKGIGRAVISEFAKRGARVAIADIDLAAAEETAHLIGNGAVAFKCNVLSDESVAETAVAAEAALGDLHIVANNVGGMLNGHPEDIPMEEWHRIMEINYFSAVRGIKHFLPKMLARGSGHLVNTASFAGFYPFAASRVPYAASKAAVISMSENLAVYAEPQGVRISCLIPGPVMTGVLDSMTSWTENCAMRGPGSELELLMVDDVAVTLADGMRDGRVLIPSDPKAWDIIAAHAADPDAFIRKKIETFEAGDSGRPIITDAVRAKLPR